LETDSDSYIDEVLAGTLTTEEIESLNKNGIPFDLWSRYRNRYAWAPTVKRGEILKKSNVSFVNGESEETWTEIDENLLRPVPELMSFKAPVNGKSTIFEVTFDEFETMEAFETLAANGEKIYLEFEPKRPRTEIKVRLHNGKESIELVKTVSKDW
jgi:hypothetical protein